MSHDPQISFFILIIINYFLLLSKIEVNELL